MCRQHAELILPYVIFLILEHGIIQANKRFPLAQSEGALALLDCLSHMTDQDL